MYAGRIKFFMHEWRQITNNPLILDWVSGYKIPFQRKPVQFGHTTVTKCTKEKHKLYTKCIQRLQDIGAVKECEKYLSRQRSSGNYNRKMEVTSSIKRELKWWLNSIEFSEQSLLQPTFTLKIFSDATKTGWGGYCNSSETKGFFGNRINAVIT
nr:unnamed protein product [Callosobruchus analis]